MTKSSTWKRALLILLPWAGLWPALAVSWENGVYYGYGWLVPPLAAVLIAGRISLPECGGRQEGTGPFWMSVVAGGLILAAFAGTLEALDPLWRRGLWMHALACFALSCSAAYAMAGWQFTFSLLGCQLFLLSAVPLPHGLEGQVIEALTTWIAEQAAVTLNFLGIPVLAQKGTLLTQQGILEVEETCSGFRSLQAAIMLALLFGEWERLAALRRLVLCAWAVVLAVVANFARTLALSVYAISHGGSIDELTHDLAGGVAFAATAAAVFLVAALLARRRRPDLEDLDPFQAGFPRPALLSGSLALVLPMIAGFLWFSPGRSASQELPVVDLAKKGIPGQVLNPEITKTSELLHYDDIALRRYELDDGQWMDLMILRYDETNSRSWTDLVGHGPEVCFRFMGLQLRRRFPVENVELNGSKWPMESYLFEDLGSSKLVYVYRLILSHSGGLLDPARHERIRWKALAARTRIDWELTLILGAVALDSPKADRARQIFLRTLRASLANQAVGT